MSKTYSKSKTLRVKIKSSLIFCSRLTFGLVVLKNFRLRPWEGCLTLIMGVIFILMLGITVIWNVFFPSVSFNNAYDEVKGPGSSDTDVYILEYIDFSRRILKRFESDRNQPKNL